MQVRHVLLHLTNVKLINFFFNGQLKITKKVDEHNVSAGKIVPSIFVFKTNFLIHNRKIFSIVRNFSTVASISISIQRPFLLLLLLHGSKIFKSLAKLD